MKYKRNVLVYNTNVSVTYIENIQSTYKIFIFDLSERNNKIRNNIYDLLCPKQMMDYFWD